MVLNPQTGSFKVVVPKSVTSVAVRIPESAASQSLVLVNTKTVLVDGRVLDVKSEVHNLDIRGNVDGDVKVEVGDISVYGGVKGNVRADVGDVTVGGDVHAGISVGAGHVSGDKKRKNVKKKKSKKSKKRRRGSSGAISGLKIVIDGLVGEEPKKGGRKTHRVRYEHLPSHERMCTY